MPRGGPSGGDGGDGGDVWLVCDDGVNHLGHLRDGQVISAERGAHGEGSTRHGRAGSDRDVPVPPGTVVRDADTGEELGDLAESGQRLRVARGGVGGRGNARFATATRQAPRHAEPGRPGERRRVELEVKLIADVGLVGRPNAGKTTLLGRLTGSRGKVAAYPFTTLEPNLGVLDLGDYRRAVLADVPGLIEGAHRGEGLGLQFLRHIERTRAIAVLVDAVAPEGDPAEHYRTLCDELRHHSPALLERPRLLVATKIDAGPDPEVLETLRDVAREDGVDYCEISAVSGQNLEELVNWVRRQVVSEGARAEAG